MCLKSFKLRTMGVKALDSHLLSEKHKKNMNFHFVKVNPLRIMFLIRPQAPRTVHPATAQQAKEHRQWRICMKPMDRMTP